MKQLLFTALLALVLVSLSTCKGDPAGPDDDCDTCTTPCDTCHNPCDTCKDTTHVPGPNDTTSHDFTWTEYTIPGEASITACWVFGPNEIWAIGGSRYVWDGTEWKKDNVIRADGVPLEGVLSGFNLFAFSSKDAWFSNGSIIEHLDGDRAQEHRVYELIKDDGGQVNAAWGTSSKNMYFVGSKGVMLHFDGANWKKFPKVTGKNLYSIGGVSSSYIWAAGRDYQKSESVLLRYDGTTWSEDNQSKRPLSETLGFGSVKAFDSSSTQIVCATGGLVWRKTGEKPWGIHDSARYPNKTPDGLRIAAGVKGNGPNDLLFQSANFLAHWNGSTWRRIIDFEDLKYWMMGSHMKGNVVCIIGEKNGQGWVAIGRRSK